MDNYHIVVGEPDEELRAIQVIGLSLADAARRLTTASSEDCQRLVVPPLLLAAAKALALATAVYVRDYP
jgi:hypothetical protein